MATHSRAMRISRLLNVVLLSALLSVVWHEHYVTRLYKRLTASPPQPRFYADNAGYYAATQFQNLYHDTATIVMLGTSLTAHIEWRELLNRCDVVNRGIGNDLTEGFIHRLDLVKRVRPRICFIEGGINDRDEGVSLPRFMANMDTIVSGLRQNSIVPVVTTVTYVAAYVPDAAALNGRTDSMNNALKTWCASRQIPVLDLNKKLAEGNHIDAHFTHNDGVHLNDTAYVIWKGEVEKVLAAQGL